MVEGLDPAKMNSSDSVDLKKRETLKVLAKAGGTLAATVAAPGVVAAADYLGNKKDASEDLGNRMHALRVYEKHDVEGLLKANFVEYQKNVRKESNAINLNEKGADLGKLKVEQMAIEALRDGYLANFDKILIPRLLVLYVQNNLQEKSLVKSYRALFSGPDEQARALDRIKKEGVLGIDRTRIGKIHSKLEYFPETNSAEATRSPLSFIAEK